VFCAHFSGKVNLRKILKSVKTMTAEEITTTYYSREERDDMRTKAVVDCQRLALEAKLLLKGRGNACEEDEEEFCTSVHENWTLGPSILDFAMPPLAIHTIGEKTETLKKVAVGKKSQCRAHFSGKVRVRKIPCVKTMKAEEITAAYYSREEFDGMRTKAVADIQRMAREANLLVGRGNACEEDEEEFCTRGLENFTPAAHQRRQKSKRLALQVVLEEQEYQRRHHMVDTPYIADLYFGRTQQSVDAARRTALLDKVEAKKCYNEI
jgi:hypothetical protein